MRENEVFDIAGNVMSIFHVSVISTRIYALHQPVVKQCEGVTNDDFPRVSPLDVIPNIHLTQLDTLRQPPQFLFRRSNPILQHPSHQRGPPTRK